MNEIEANCRSAGMAQRATDRISECVATILRGFMNKLPAEAYAIIEASIPTRSVSRTAQRGDHSVVRAFSRSFQRGSGGEQARRRSSSVSTMRAVRRRAANGSKRTSFAPASAITSSISTTLSFAARSQRLRSLSAGRRHPRRIYDKLGAHPMNLEASTARVRGAGAERPGVSGSRFNF